MIAVYEFLWKRLEDYSSKYQSGLDTVDNFNSRLAEVQIELYSALSPYYQTNEKVRNILEPWRKKLAGTAVNSSITLPTAAGSFDRIVSMAVTQTGVPTNILFEINPIIEGEIVMYNRIPQRKPDFSAKQVYYIMESQSTVADKEALATVSLTPLIASLDYVMYYLVFPYEAKIAFTESSTDDEDILTYDAADSVDLAWDMNAANIILYMMLEKYGVSVREQILESFAELGINKTMGGKAA